MMRPTHQEIYAAAQDMQNRCRFDQAMLLQALGGKIMPGSTDTGDRFDFDAVRWHVTLLGISASGDDMPSALDAWIRAARLYHTLDGTRRATDGRPDCPYNGQAPLPETLPVAEAGSLTTHQLAGA
ncbi:hypothetical protein [Leisingera aquaemixtae]|uniref:hypothetical protein n=1 Tax=Leisingera aquaemixtae TaxID=1396826 RepID=UPI0021A6EFF7|nr:hypothetical protein [Leisingera aquaemixtae]UWQ47286.1 hypothetical protein K3719_07950 [Leisingera aquaemixtae]